MEHHATAGPAWAAALQGSAVGELMRQSTWLYPAVECLHILGFALLFGAIASYDIRALRASGSAALESLGALLLPIARAGFLLAVPMGLLLFTTEATAYLRNPAFLTKLALLGLAFLNIAWFHLRLRALRAGPAVPRVLRASALVSLVVWTGVLLAGRLIAYV